MKCTVVFKRNSEGEIEMYRQVNRTIAQEAGITEESMRLFMRRLSKTLQELSVNQRLVLNCEMQEYPMRQGYGM